MLDYFDQLVYADHFEKKLPELLEERKNVSVSLEKWIARVKKDYSELNNNDQNDNNIKSDVLMKKFSEYDKKFWAQAKEDCNLKDIDNGKLTNEQEEQIQKKWVLLEKELESKSDEAIKLILSLKFTQYSDSYPDNEFKDMSVGDYCNQKLSNSPLLFVENGILEQEFKKEKLEKLNDMSFDKQLDNRAHNIILDGFNLREECVYYSNVTFALRKYSLPNLDNPDSEKLNLDIKALVRNIANGIVFTDVCNPRELL